jgi:hypothetical protein
VIDIDALPIEVQEYIKQLRNEASKYRIDRNKLRIELDLLKVEIGR